MKKKTNIEDLLSDQAELSGDSRSKTDKVQWSIAETILKFLKNHSPYEGFDKEKAFEIIQRKVRTRRRLVTLRVAAAAAVVVMGLATVFYQNSGIRESEFIENASRVDAANAIQLVSGNTSHSFAGQNLAFKISPDGKWISADDSLLALTPTKNHLVVPYGHKARIILGDGTAINVNSGSHIEFPSVFDGGKRIVGLTGEAFFDVAKDKDHPFVVQTRQVDVQVLGTQFNLTAYPDDSFTRTVLTEGSVSLSSTNTNWFAPKEELILKPGDMGLWEDNSEAFSSLRVDPELYTSWRNGSLKVDDEYLGTFLKKLGRHYNVRFDIRNEALQSQRYSGTFTLEEDLDLLLPILGKVLNVEIQRSGDLVIVE